ncbi:MAG: hypothetical protein ACE5FO_01520 [Parvularculaceae bacterium]
MFKLFSKTEADFWPLAQVLDSLKRHYGGLEHLGDEGGISLYGVNDNGVNFVVALVQPDGANGKVVEIGFLASFVGFAVDQQAVDMLNRNLHISMVGVEGGALILLAGLQVAGPFDDGKFSVLLEAWRRDLAMVLYTLSGQASLTEAFPAARFEAARRFAANTAPIDEAGADEGGQEVSGADPGAATARAGEMFTAFLGAGAAKALCEACGGRGRRGFISRTCEDCDGSGFVARMRSRRR